MMQYKMLAHLGGMTDEEADSTMRGWFTETQQYREVAEEIYRRHIEIDKRVFPHLLKEPNEG